MNTTPLRLPIDTIIIGKRHRRDLGDISGLARDIERNGLFHPVVITPGGNLIAGERRIAAYKHLGRTDIEVTVIDLDDIRRGELAENVHRKDFLPSEIDAIRRALEPIEKEAAKERQTASLKKGDEKPVVETFHNGGKTRDKVAAFAGRSGRTVEKIRAIVEAAESEPEKFGKLVEDMDRTGRVDGPYMRLKVARQAEGIRAEPPPFPDKGPYRVAVIDPPLPYDLSSEDPSHRATHPYPQMSIAQISALPVQRLTHEDSILWLWMTNFHMPEAFGLLDAWGFKHRTILTWVKDRPGRGAWLRGQTEHCLMAVRGKPVVQLTDQTTVLLAPLRANSQKPDEFYALVERLCPAPRYLELFSRQQRPSWDGHGDESQAPTLEDDFPDIPPSLRRTV